MDMSDGDLSPCDSHRLPEVTGLEPIDGLIGGEDLEDVTDTVEDEKVAALSVRHYTVDV